MKTKNVNIVTGIIIVVGANGAVKVVVVIKENWKLYKFKKKETILFS